MLVINQVARRGARTAEVLHAVKVTLMVLNALSALVFVIAGIMARPGLEPVVRSDGYIYDAAPADGGTLWWILVVYGVLLATFGSLLIFAFVGFLQHLLAVQAESLRLQSLWFEDAIQIPEGSLTGENLQAGSVQQAPMNFPLATDR